VSAADAAASGWRCKRCGARGAGSAVTDRGDECAGRPEANMLCVCFQTAGARVVYARLR
jgi:hypothetical protein